MSIDLIEAPAATKATARHSLPRRVMTALLLTGGLACVVWAAVSTWSGVLALGFEVKAALWTLLLTIPLHLLQLLLSGAAWRVLLPGAAPGLATFFRLRTVREGIDSLLPVAQVGGELVGARLLTERGVAQAAARASVLVDVTIELVAQILFLLGGLAGLAALGDATDWAGWTEATLAAITGAALLLLAQRFGVLRLLETLIRRMAARWPMLAGASLSGLEAAAARIYHRPAALLQAGVLQLTAWVGGGIETWLVLRALGVPVSPAQALVIESLGMAARSAGFAVPGALGVQEGGFMLAAAAIGLPESAGLSLSLLKRAREVLVGALGLLLWRLP